MSEGVYLAAAVLGLVNGVVLLLVNPRRTINQVYFAGTVLTAGWFLALITAFRIGDATPPDTVSAPLLFWLRVSAALSAFIVWHIALMRVVLLEDPVGFRRALARSLPWLALSTLLAVLSFTEAYIPSYSTPAIKARGPAYLAFALITFTGGLWMFVDSLRRLRRLTGVRRLELQFFVLLAVFAGLLMVLNSVIAYFFPDLSWLRRTGPILISIWQGAVIWAVCHHRLFDAQQMVLQAGQRVLFFSILAAGALALWQGLRLWLGDGPALFVSALTACAVAVFGDRPMRRWLGVDPERRMAFLRRRVIGWTREGLDEEQLTVRMEGLLRECCQTECASLLPMDAPVRPDPVSVNRHWPGLDVVTRDGWITPEALQRQRELAGTPVCQEFLARHNLGAMLAVPTGSPTPSLIVVLGTKPSLRPYTYPEIRLLLELAELMDNILTHSRVAAHTAAIEKMESAAMMSRGLAHDLNNLATPVSTFLLHMEGRVTPGTAEAEVLADAKHSIRVMQDYIRESLFYARRLVPDFQPVSSTELLTSTLGLTQTRAKNRGVEVVLGPSAGLAFRADRVLLLRMLQNLVSNGIDASPEGGRVTLTAEPHDLDHIDFTVTDEGPGVPAALVSRIFEPYFTTKDTGNRTRGLGLGLAISLKIGSLHGGTITVGRASSGGAVFTATLPLSPRSLV